MPTSSKWNLNSIDIKKVIQNAELFFAPLLLIYLGFISSNISTKGVHLATFEPDQIVLGAIALYVVNVITDMLRKLLSDNGKQIPPTTPTA